MTRQFLLRLSCSQQEDADHRRYFCEKNNSQTRYSLINTRVAVSCLPPKLDPQRPFQVTFALVVFVSGLEKQLMYCGAA